jgi:hypothetical protein
MGDLLAFESFPKIDRWTNETATITEKIDGTNAAFTFDPDGHLGVVQSRKRIITPGKQSDNAGFAGWVSDNAEQLFALFGPGRHFGEWWGAGIQRTYGAIGKHFSPFNTKAWPNDRPMEEVGGVPVKGVPTLAITTLDLLAAELAYAHRRLVERGSFAMGGFMDPEGCMIYLHRLGRYLKAPLDPTPKHVLALIESERNPQFDPADVERWNAEAAAAPPFDGLIEAA